MKVIGIHTNSHEENLSARLVQAALRGAEEAGADVEMIPLHEYTLEACRVCGGGWGTCREEGRCELPDGLQEIRDRVESADGMIFCTLVHFGDVSEDARRLLDRWRRCEFFRREGSPLRGKPAIAIAVAGNSGGGCIDALHVLERYLTVLQFSLVDLVPVTNRSLPWREPGLEAAGRSLVECP